VKLLKNLFSDAERVKTALLLLGVIALFILIDHPLLVWVLFGAIYLIGVYEANRLFGLNTEHRDTNILYVVATIIWIGAWFFSHPAELSAVALVLFAALIAYRPTTDKRLLLPLLYPTLPMLFLFALYTQFGMSALIWLLVIVSSADVGAYAFGKSFGKRPFSPTSPNKTLEGVAGGILTAALLGALVGLSFMPLWLAFITSFLAAKASVFGDLFESYLKRQAGVKDSGNILPGHGGILDRMDGYFFGSIILYMLLITLQ